MILSKNELGHCVDHSILTHEIALEKESLDESLAFAFAVVEHRAQGLGIWGSGFLQETHRPWAFLWERVVKGQGNTNLKIHPIGPIH